METVRAVEPNYSDGISPNTITIRKHGKEVIIAWEIAGFWADCVVIDQRQMQLLSAGQKLTVWLKPTPTSASPQG
jgi:hypothetical protein